MGLLDGGSFLRAPEKYFYELFERINVLADCGTPNAQRGGVPRVGSPEPDFLGKILKILTGCLMKSYTPDGLLFVGTVMQGGTMGAPWGHPTKTKKAPKGLSLCFIW
jgi:hypothetical protein